MSNKKNILITSAGRRVELINLWKESASNLLGEESLIFTSDINEKFSSASYFSHKSIQICSCQEKEYPEVLLEQCLINNIKLVLPTIDTELYVLAKNREKFQKAGIEIIVSDIEFINACHNKKLTSKLFKKLDIDTPAILDKNKLNFPFFLKPVSGSASKGVKVVLKRDDLNNSEINSENYIFQELVPKSWTEYSVDLYFDKLGYLKSCVPRERLSTRGGEINKGITRKNEVFNYLLEKISHVNGVRGVITFQLFTDPERKKFLAIEINPRFGGGYPMSHYAGAKFPDMLINEYILKKKIKSQNNWKKNLLMLRYDSMIVRRIDE